MDVKKERKEGGGTDCNMEDGDTTMYLNMDGPGERGMSAAFTSAPVSCPAHVAEESLIRSDLTFPEAHTLSSAVACDNSTAIVIAICPCQ